MIVVYIITLLLAMPFALLLAKFCRDELKDWKYRFKIISLVSTLSAIAIHFSNLEYKIPIIVGLLFIMVTLVTLIHKTN